AWAHLPVEDPFAGFVEGDVGNGGRGEHRWRFARAQFRHQLANQWQVRDNQHGSDTFVAERLEIGTHKTDITTRCEFREYICVVWQDHTLPDHIQRLFCTQERTHQNAFNVHFLTFKPGSHLTGFVAATDCQTTY